MKAALYARVSTDMQNEGYSIDAQKELLKKYCEVKQIKDYDYYVDGGYSGSNINRPMLTKLIQDCKNKKVNIVIVYKLDRLSRSQKDTLYLIEEVFIPNGVDFISISENFDTTTAYGKAMIGILSVFAQLERETIKERTRMGMKERIKGGYWPGGGKLPYGYDYDKSKGILVKNERAESVKKMFELYLSGWSAERIAKYFNIKYDKIVMQILKSKINCGLIEYKGTVYEGLHEPIVSKEIFDETAKLIRQRSKSKLKQGSFLLSGIIYCGKCGSKMRYQKWGKKGYKICCYSQQSSKEYMIKDPNCQNKKHWAYEIEDAVLGQLFAFSLNPKQIENKKDHAHQLNITAIKKNIAEVNKKINNLIDFISEGLATDEIKASLIKLSEQKKALVQELKNINYYNDKNQLFLDKITNLNMVWDDLSFDEKKAVIRLLIDKIVITDDKADIYYAFEN